MPTDLPKAPHRAMTSWESIFQLVGVLKCNALSSHPLQIFHPPLYPNKKLSTSIITHILYLWPASSTEYFTLDSLNGFLYIVLAMSLTCRTKQIENEVSIIKERGTNCACLGSEFLRSHHKHCVILNRNTAGVTCLHVVIRA